MNTTIRDVETVTTQHGWEGLKWYLSHRTGISDDALHLHAGLLILMVAALLWRRAPWHWLPWATVLVLEIANEAVDLLAHTAGEDSWGASAHDLVMTLVWPTVILLVFPRLIRRYG